MPRLSFTILPVAVLLTLAACGSGGGTAISINSSGADGNMTFGSDANGQFAIDTPGFKGKFTLPKVKLDASDFDMNGVHLYPGSTIGAMNIEGHDKAGADSDGSVRVTFASPAAVATVRDWFKQKLAAADFKVAPDGTGLSGKTDEGKPFKLDLTANGTDKTNGVITIG